jgi:toxin-antitoxin system PIN domain toxin
MLVDANLLLYAVDRASPFHQSAAEWLTGQLNGPRRVGLPWESLVAFVRISTHPRAAMNPLDPDEALRQVQNWLAPEVAWVPTPGPRHATLLVDLISRHQLRGNLVGDAHLAALALEHGLTLCSTDTDFARFPELSWHNPLR